MQLEDIWRHHLRLRRAVETFDGDGCQTHAEITQIKDDLTRENELVIVLLLVAAAEAQLQAEADAVASRPAPTRFEAKMAGVLMPGRKRTPPRTPQLRDILNVWADPAWATTAVMAIVAEFLAIQDLRHWLAHGRHWAAPTMVDPALAWHRIGQLFAELGMAMPSQPTGLI